MRVVSWNVWWRFGDRWRERQHGILTTLRRLAPDVVGLQETWAGEATSQAEVLAEALALHPVLAVPSLPPVPDPPESPDQEGIELGVAVLGRWPVVGVRRHPLPARHRSPAPVALHATLDHPSGPLHVVCTCTEWEPSYADDHLAQTRALADLLTDPALDGPLPVLLTADLNAAPGTPPMAPLSQVTIDTWATAARHDGPDDDRGTGDDATLSSANPFAPREARQQIDRRIDYVLARPGHPSQKVTVDRAFLARAPVDGLPPSDHYAVVTDLAV